VKSKKVIIAIMAAATMLLIFVATAWSQDRYYDRQTDRIYTGKRSGEITRQDYSRRENQQDRRERDTQWGYNDRHYARHYDPHEGRYANRYQHGRPYYRNHEYRREYNGYRDDHRYCDPSRSQDRYSFSGAWINPGWGFSFFSDNRYDR
jgi:hypothetical protein